MPGDAARDAACDERATLDRGPATEWWVPRGRGLQQGWTVDTPTSGPLEIVVDLTEGSIETIDDDGLGATLTGSAGGSWRYEGLAAWDATGTPLTTALADRGGDLVVSVDAATATWPVTVDPVLTPGVALQELDADDRLYSGQQEFYGRTGEVGDFNGDGYDDLAVGASSDGTAEFGFAARGAVYVCSGGPAGIDQATELAAGLDHEAAYIHGCETVTFDGNVLDGSTTGLNLSATDGLTVGASNSFVGTGVGFGSAIRVGSSVDFVADGLLLSGDGSHAVSLDHDSDRAQLLDLTTCGFDVAITVRTADDTVVRGGSVGGANTGVHVRSQADDTTIDGVAMLGNGVDILDEGSGTLILDPLVMTDGDGDGAGDTCDPCPLDPADDSDGDGSCDSDDTCPGHDDTTSMRVFQELADEAPELAAGTDPLDADTDGDGVDDGADAFPLDAGESADSDGDGTGDAADLCPGFDDTQDGDGDGIPDGCDALACGDIITQDTTLTEDLVCPAGFTGNAITFGADDVTLDGAGFRIVMDNVGIVVSAASRSGLAIQNLDLSTSDTGAFGLGVHLTSCVGCLVTGNDLTGRSYAIELSDGSDNVITANVGGGAGIALHLFRETDPTAMACPTSTRHWPAPSRSTRTPTATAPWTASTRSR